MMLAKFERNIATNFIYNSIFKAVLPLKLIAVIILIYERWLKKATTVMCFKQFGAECGAESLFFKEQIFCRKV